MVKAKINNLKLFEYFISTANKFVQQAQLIITKEKTSIFAVNTKDFSTSLLLLDSNSLTLDEDSKIDVIKYCTKDLSSLKSAISIVMTVENINECEIELENVESNTKEIYAKTFKYNGNAKFKLISIDSSVIENFIGRELSVELTPDWEFDINTSNLDIIQNRTGNICDTSNDVSIYIVQDYKNNKVLLELKSILNTYMNSIALPIATSYKGGLFSQSNSQNSIPLTEVAIHPSAIRLFNILKVKDGLHCIFSKKYNIFKLESSLLSDDNKFFIKARVLNQIIKGK